MLIFYMLIDKPGIIVLLLTWLLSGINLLSTILICHNRSGIILEILSLLVFGIGSDVSRLEQHFDINIKFHCKTVKMSEKVFLLPLVWSTRSRKNQCNLVFDMIWFAYILIFQLGQCLYADFKELLFESHNLTARFSRHKFT